MSAPAHRPEGVDTTHADQRTLAEAARSFARYDFVADAERLVLEAQVAAARLSPDLRRSLITFRRFGSRSGGLVIRGVPIGPVPPTPSRAHAAVGTTLAASRAMSVLLACLGDQYSFRPELGGNLVQDVLPVRGFESDQISTASTVELMSHTEMAFSPLRADFVALLCVRPDHECVAATTLSSVESMIPLLDDETVTVLREPRFRTKVDASFLLGDDVSHDIWVDPIQVFEGLPGRPRLRVDFAETDGKDPTARRALARLNEVAVETQRETRLEAGEMLIVDNNRALHGRTAFVPRYDGRDRWLLRAFVTLDLRRSEAFRPGDSRIVEPDYDLTQTCPAG